MREWKSLHKIVISANEEDGVPEVFEQYVSQVNSRTPAGSTPLHLAALGTNTELVKALLHAGAKILRNHNRETPLHWAAHGGSAAVFHLLLSHATKRQLMIKDKDGKTSMDWAYDTDRTDLHFSQPL